MPTANQARLVTVLLMLALPVLVLLAIPMASSGAATYGPKKNKVFTGVSDNGTLESFLNFADSVGKHPAVLQTFHPWGNGLDIAYKRWQNAEVRPMLHISTADDETREELITPKQIAKGEGDAYLLEINEFFAGKDMPAYIRPLGEPNRCLNPYSAVYCDGTRKGGDHKAFWFRKAFRRIAVIVRGGKSAKRLDTKLANLEMNPVNYGLLPRPASLLAAPVAIIWSTLPAGSPRAKGNWPGNYWPGSNFVDWAGVDFYSNYPDWKDLNKFFDSRTWSEKPVALTEWGIAGSDNVKFTRQIFNWMKKRKRVRMFNYYRGFGGSEDIFNPINYPNAIKVMKNKLKDSRYVPYAYKHASKPEG
jgi:hypothetical protein